MWLKVISDLTVIISTLNIAEQDNFTVLPCVAVEQFDCHR